MQKLNDNEPHSIMTPVTPSFPRSRKSHCAQQSLTREINRLRSMTIEARVLEALGMNQRFDWLKSISKDA